MESGMPFQVTALLDECSPGLIIFGGVFAAKKLHFFFLFVRNNLISVMM